MNKSVKSKSKLRDLERRPVAAIGNEMLRDVGGGYPQGTLYYGGTSEGAQCRLDTYFVAAE